MDEKCFQCSFYSEVFDIIEGGVQDFNNQIKINIDLLSNAINFVN